MRPPRAPSWTLVVTVRVGFCFCFGWVRLWWSSARLIFAKSRGGRFCFLLVWVCGCVRCNDAEFFVAEIRILSGCFSFSRFIYVTLPGSKVVMLLRSITKHHCPDVISIFETVQVLGNRKIPI